MLTPKRIGNRLRTVTLAALFVLGASACGGSYGAPGDMLGATPGGAQDIGKAREIIHGGSVPTVEDFTPEGLYSEHDLVIANAPPCAKTLCVNTAVGPEFGSDDDNRDPAAVARHPAPLLREECHASWPPAEPEEDCKHNSGRDYHDRRRRRVGMCLCEVGIEG